MNTPATHDTPQRVVHWTESEPVRLSSHRVGRVYLAGPMTGLVDFNFPAFHAEAAILRAQGLTVINPAEHGIVEGAAWADYLRHDIAGLASCERIHLLRGWESSKGARLEVHIAQQLGMVITRQEGAALQSQPAAETASQKFVRLKVADEVRSPLEQLRSFCSFAMSGQDWIDCEPFFDAIVESAQPAAAGVSDADVWELWLRVCAESDNVSTRVMIANFARAILALRPQSESEQEKELRRSLAEAQATISERNAEIIELQKRIRRSPQAVPMTEQWRLLRSGERIESGDEGLQDDCVTWLPLSGWEVGMTYSPTVLVPMRRRVPGITAQGAQGGEAK